jgi:hypothetical protein
MWCMCYSNYRNDCDIQNGLQHLRLCLCMFGGLHGRAASVQHPLAEELPALELGERKKPQSHFSANGEAKGACGTGIRQMRHHPWLQPNHLLPICSLLCFLSLIHSLTHLPAMSSLATLSKFSPMLTLPP